MVKFQGEWSVDGVARKRPHMAMAQSAVPWGGGAMFLSSEAGCPVVMTLWVTRSQRSHDGRNACAGGMREWCGRRERSD